MYSLGHKIEVPPHHNTKAWSLLYDYLTQPARQDTAWRTCEELDPERSAENVHWQGCKVRRNERGRGCERCEGVAERAPDWDKVRGRWNEVVY